MTDRLDPSFPSLMSWRAQAGDPARAKAVLEECEGLLAAETSETPWADWLDATRAPAFLRALPDDAARRRWADLAIGAVRAGGVTLETLLDQRVAAHPDRHYLRRTGDRDGVWTYSAVRRQARRYAAGLRGLEARPRVALITPNSLPGAVVDLACLLHGLFITPLAPNLDAPTVAWILERLEINVLITGRTDQHALGRQALELHGGNVRHLALEDIADLGDGVEALDELVADLDAATVDARLEAQPRLGLDDVATVMFTSGSTGRPKGVSFSLANIVTKRFARAAALPDVGEDEVLLCYLPLFHTFGRFLELTGMLFWGGTYVFTGSTSRDTLLSMLPRVRPTGLIGIPLRWKQIHETGEDAGGEGLRALVGDRLRWGLSAAGYLEPRIFRSFQRHGVALCSGFGMTEATGGITMTPPGDYVSDSVGVPLPGVETRLSDEGELQIRGSYVAGYLDPEPERFDDGWLRTGDIFRAKEHDHLEIVDRLKDIYKNTRGQTIAPRRVEARFAEVPGVARCFLVGDHRNDNVLLIAPDADDPVFRGDPYSPEAREYFARIVTLANADLAPHERVVNFAVLERDFSAEKDELTPKGSFRRKTIEANFAPVIDELYGSSSVELRAGDVAVALPRWFHRELGVLESDITVDGSALVDAVRGVRLEIERIDGDRVRVGDLIYDCGAEGFDLGLMSRQPRLWVGNGALAAFAPVRDGWDARLGPFTEHVSPHRPGETEAPSEEPEPHGHLLRLDQRLLRIHELSRTAASASGERAVLAVEALGRILELADHRTSELIRRRLEAQAEHPAMEMRSLAYRILVLDEPSPDVGDVRPRFLASGLPFLDETSIDLIASDVVEERRLVAFRQRLASYRRRLDWPADAVTRGQFDRIFRLLAEFARNRPTFYRVVRDELITWALHDEDPEIAAKADHHVLALGEWFEHRLDEEGPHHGEAAWHEKISFQEGLSAEEILRLRGLIVGTTFLQQSVMLCTEGERLDVRDVPRDGVWISRTAVRKRQRLYRVAVNTVAGKHYDLLVGVWDPDLVLQEREELHRTIYWMVALGGHPHGDPCVPRFGCWRPAMGALSTTFVNNLNVWERIREYASDQGPAQAAAHEPNWRRLFVQAMAAFFRVWRNSGESIVPGMITPMNVAVPEPDFRTGAMVLSLSDWKPYEDTLSLVRPMLRNFFKQTSVNFPRVAKQLDLSWIGHAAYEALGRERALDFLRTLRDDLTGHRLDGYRGRLANELEDMLPRFEDAPVLGCALRGAVGRYRRWETHGGEASGKAKLQQVNEMIRLYGLNREAELDRYLLYRHTIFHRSDEAVRKAFDRLLLALFREPDRPATDHMELSDLQELAAGGVERDAFKRMAFPRSKRQTPTLLKLGEAESPHVVVGSEIRDKRGVVYQVRDPLDAAEIGKLYRHFFKSGYYRTISERDRFYVVLDDREQVVGGICWQTEERSVVHLNGIVVAPPLLGRGISSVLIEDFCDRMANLGHEIVKTHYVLRPFFERHGFAVDRQWGGLVRRLLND